MPRTLAPEGPTMRLVLDSAPQRKHAARAHWRSPRYPRSVQITALSREGWLDYADTGPYTCPGTELPPDPRRLSRRTLIIDLSAIPEAHTWDPSTQIPAPVLAHLLRKAGRQ